MPKPRVQKRKVLVRRDPTGPEFPKEKPDRRLVNRSRVLRKPEHRAPDNAGEAIPFEFLIAFVRRIIRENPSTDVYYLAMAGAKRMCPITPEQEEAFMQAVLHEAENNEWPKDFF